MSVADKYERLSASLDATVESLVREAWLEGYRSGVRNYGPGAPGPAEHYEDWRVYGPGALLPGGEKFRAERRAEAGSGLRMTTITSAIPDEGPYLCPNCRTVHSVTTWTMDQPGNPGMVAWACSGECYTALRALGFRHAPKPTQTPEAGS